MYHIDTSYVKHKFNILKFYINYTIYIYFKFSRSYSIICGNKNY